MAAQRERRMGGGKTWEDDETIDPIGHSPIPFVMIICCPFVDCRLSEQVCEK